MGNNLTSLRELPAEGNQSVQLPQGLAPHQPLKVLSQRVMEPEFQAYWAADSKADINIEFTGKTLDIAQLKRTVEALRIMRHSSPVHRGYELMYPPITTREEFESLLDEETNLIKPPEVAKGSDQKDLDKITTGCLKISLNKQN